MSPQEIEHLVASLAPVSEGRRGPIPARFEFCGKPIEIFLQTEPIPRELARDANEAELHLVHLVLGNLEAVLAHAEEAFREHYAESPEFIDAVKNPHIWINEDAIECDGPERWSFIVENSQNEFYGTHLVFDGLVFLEAWGGD